MTNVKRLVLCLAMATLGASLLQGEQRGGTSRQDPTPESLQAEIKDLRADKVAWREVAWRTCLIEGLRESRETQKPVLLWVFNDRPVQEPRC